MTDRSLERRYVVLHHTGHGESHHDLMIEPEPGAERLWTWRTPAWPLAEGAPLAPLPPHRREYLDYEGPISGGRGEVRRVARGLCRLAQAEAGRPQVSFDQAGFGKWVLGPTARRV